MENWKKLTSKLITRKEIGYKYEKIALEFLTKNKLILHSQNYSCKHGEIDLIMLDNDTFVFVEVRYRKSVSFGTPLDTINIRKQTKLKKTAIHFLQKNNLLNHYCRFDAISIDKKNGLNWVKNAFE